MAKITEVLLHASLISHFSFSAQRRAVYDQFGEEGLKNGVPTTKEGAFKLT